MHQEERLSSLYDLIVNQGFWRNVARDAGSKIKGTEIRGKTHKDTTDSVIEAEHKAVRAGPGYFNWVIGGASKINFIYGKLHDGSTSGQIVDSNVDSITDQGEHPHVSRAEFGANA